MEHSWERPGSPVFQRAFTISLAATIWLLLVIVAAVTNLWPRNEWLEYVLALAMTLLAYQIATRVLRAIRRRRPTFLEAAVGATAAEGLLSIAIWSVLIYATLAALIGAGLYVTIPRDDHHWPMVVMGLAIWIPFFLAVPPASLIAWRRARG